MTSADDFAYPLPEDRIAQQPAEPRHAARLLVDLGPDRAPEDRTVADLPRLVGPGDLLVVNDTRVLHARLHLHKASGGAVEVLLLASGDEPGRWEALVKASRRVAPGTELRCEEGSVVVGAHLGDGRRAVTVEPGLIERIGEVPLPPYIRQPLADDERYQTVFARAEATSVAAPTAGLHLSDEVLDGCREAGAGVAAIELDVGLGTFRPIATDRVEDHHMHAERYHVDPSVLARCEDADRVVAIGTTVVRALESAATTGHPTGSTDLFIHGAHPFRVVDALLTNFHVPRSSLLVLVDAFIGPRWRDLYDHALANGYRFLSFGDAMLVNRT